MAEIQSRPSFHNTRFLRGVNFSINYINNNLIITPQNIQISKDAFINTLHYLNDNMHDDNNPCDISSSNNPANARPLCLISRQANNNVRCINYILPILAEHGIVAIDGNQPNKTWLRLTYPSQSWHFSNRKTIFTGI